jgi:predicted negative regulator of RcsB-dependent stress response
MATYDLEEQEQLAELKTWWQQYGNRVTSIAVALALAVAAWQGWQWWQHQQSAKASVIYSGLQQAARQKDTKRVKELAGELIEKYAGTSYAGMGALIAARIQVDQGDTKNARLQLAWAAEHANDIGLRALARLRLATVLLDEKSYDEALKQLAVEPPAPFAARYADVRGDIYVAQGKLAEAAKSYDDALARIDAAEKGEEIARHQAYRELLQNKRDALGVDQ